MRRLWTYLALIASTVTRFLLRRPRKRLLVPAILVTGVIVLGVLWSAGAPTGGATGQDAARLVAAEFLDVKPEILKPSEGPGAEWAYAFRFTKGEALRGRISVNREPLYVCGGSFQREMHEGERVLNRDDAVRVARAFARQHFPDFDPLGRPTPVKELSMGPRPAWGVAWEILDAEGPARVLGVGVDAISGEVLNFRARKEHRTGALLRAKVSRKDAVKLATSQAPAGWRVLEVKAKLSRTWRRRPLGYPVWGVTLHLEEDIAGEDRPVMGQSWTVDAVTGDLIVAETGEVLPIRTGTSTDAQPATQAEPPQE